MPKIRDFNRVTALYERLSKDDEQQGESNSILNQKRFLEDFARKSGMTNIKHFTDDGYTGRNFNRPGFQAILEAAGFKKSTYKKSKKKAGVRSVKDGFLWYWTLPEVEKPIENGQEVTDEDDLPI